MPLALWRGAGCVAPPRGLPVGEPLPLALPLAVADNEYAFVAVTVTVFVCDAVNMAVAEGEDVRLR